MVDIDWCASMDQGHNSLIFCILVLLHCQFFAFFLHFCIVLMLIWAADWWAWCAGWDKDKTFSLWHPANPPTNLPSVPTHAMILDNRISGSNIFWKLCSSHVQQTVYRSSIRVLKGRGTPQSTCLTWPSSLDLNGSHYYNIQVMLLDHTSQIIVSGELIS